VYQVSLGFSTTENVMPASTFWYALFLSPFKIWFVSANVTFDLWDLERFALIFLMSAASKPHVIKKEAR